MQKHADPAATMQRLEKWAAVHQNFKIEQYGCRDICSGFSVRLYCDSSHREITAHEGDLMYDAEDNLTGFTPTVVDVIALALDRWDGLVPQYGESDD